MERDMSPGRRWGREQRLTPEASRADKSCMASVQASGDARNPVGRWRERGQAMVEFAIIAPVFFLLVAGIIQFGIGLNWWLDMQRIANQGARWAVVDAFPGCPRNTTPTCGSTPSKSLQTYLAREEISGSLNPCVEISFPDPDGAGAEIGEAKTGNPVKVTLREVKFDLIPLLGFGLTLEASATMRQEWKGTQYQAASYDESGTAC